MANGGKGWGIIDNDTENSFSLSHSLGPLSGVVDKFSVSDGSLIDEYIFNSEL